MQDSAQPQGYRPPAQTQPNLGRQQTQWAQPQVPRSNPSPNPDPNRNPGPNPDTGTNPNPNRTAFEESEMFPGQFKPVPEETIVSWRAPSRPFKKRNKQFYTTVATIVFLISLILFFAGQFLPIAVVISVAFLAYVLSSVPPHEVTNKISTYGIRIEDELYYWEEMGRFWFEDKFQQKLLKVEVGRFPGRLTILLGEMDKEELEKLLKEVLVKEKPKDTFFDKSAKWLQEKVPLDSD
jgi:hypothetical protein